MTQNVRLQNLRDFTVQIRNAADQIVGTGIAVSTDGKIVTCAHVIEAALKAHPREANGAEVGIYFPQARGGEEKKYSAKVNCCFPIHDDDMVLLQIIGEKSPLAPEQIAVLGMADQSEGNPFRTYGYSPIGDYPATRGDGFILGTVEPPANRNLQVDPVQLKSRDIAAGMSGAAVLDVTRNLVVGLVMERFYPAGAVQDDIGYGVDSKVLTFDPFDFVLRGEALELKPAPELRLDKDLYQQAIEIVEYVRKHRKPADSFSWNAAPAVLDEWTGRDDLLAQITEDWNNLQKHVTGLIGFGGEGKSSLARKWVDDVVRRGEFRRGESETRPYGDGTPDGIFWWGFYENRSIDEFLEAALNFMSGGRIDPRQVPSSSLRAQIIGAMLGAGRYLFILDGLEVLQHQDGDQYGLLTSNDLRDLLTYFARPDNQSFCLITSRAPVLDLMDYTTYTHRDVERFSEADGRDLLKKLGVKGSEALMDKVVSDWDGHALTISLLGSFTAENYGGDVVKLALGGEEYFPIPTANESRYARVHRVLRRYDEHLTEIERDFLKVFSAFRIPTSKSAISLVFKKLLNFPAKKSPDQILSRLQQYRILRFNTISSTYTTHPLIHAHYSSMLSSDTPNRVKTVHAFIKKYYVTIARQNTNSTKIENLTPLLEAIHHACLASDFDGAMRLYRKIEKGYSSKLMFSLGAYDTYIELARNFFPNGDFLKDTFLNKPIYRGALFVGLGIALSTQCFPHDALKFHQADLEMSIKSGKNIEICWSYQNLAETFLYVGEFKESEQAALKAAEFAHRARSSEEEWGAFAYAAFAAYLMGEVDTAEERFGLALELLKKSEPNTPHLLDMWGGWQALYLLRMDRLDEAHAVVMFNLDKCKDSPEVASQLNSVLGDCYLVDRHPDNALQSYNKSIQIARNISSRATLVEALIKRGYFFAKYSKNCEEAFSDLSEALYYSLSGRCKWYEADIRVALGWAYLANGEKEKATQSAQRALQMSQEMGYHWGKVDAQEVVERLED